jgi:hypothetical protein
MDKINAPLNAFYPSLNDFCRKYYVINHMQPLNALEIEQYPIRLKEQESSLFEHLLIFDTMSIKVFGENIPLVLLLNLFGQRGLEELVEQRAFRFVLWTPNVVHMVTDMPGINAIASGNLNSVAHCDPEKSIELGLNWLNPNPTTQLKKILKRKIAPLYDIPPIDLSGTAVEMASSAFKSGKLKPLGLDPEVKRLDSLNLPDRKLLGECATELLEYRFLLSRQMTSISDYKYFSFFSDSIRRITTSNRLLSSFSELAKLEDFPDLKALYPTLQSALERVPKLRMKRDARKFREWFALTTAGDSSLTKEYINAIVDSKGFLDTTTGKFIKSIALTAIGAIAGKALEGTFPAAMAGGAIAKAAEPAVDLGLDLLDEFLLVGLRKGWNPRM